MKNMLCNRSHVLTFFIFFYRDKNYVMERSAANLKSGDMSRTPVMPLVSLLIELIYCGLVS